MTDEKPTQSEPLVYCTVDNGEHVCNLHTGHLGPHRDGAGWEWHDGQSEADPPAPAEAQDKPEKCKEPGACDRCRAEPLCYESSKTKAGRMTDVELLRDAITDAHARGAFSGIRMDSLLSALKRLETLTRSK